MPVVEHLKMPIKEDTIETVRIGKGLYTFAWHDVKVE